MRLSLDTAGESLIHCAGYSITDSVPAAPPCAARSPKGFRYVDQAKYLRMLSFGRNSSEQISSGRFYLYPSRSSLFPFTLLSDCLLVCEKTKGMQGHSYQLSQKHSQLSRARSSPSSLLRRYLFRMTVSKKKLHKF
jgi:hypothetical protein